MNNTTIASVVITNGVSISLSLSPYELNIYFGLFLWLTGNIGSIGNMIVFNSRSFRGQACTKYLFSQSIMDFIYFNFVLLTRIIQKGFQIPLTTRYEFICKFRQFLSFWGNQISFTFFSFATIDRILSTKRSNNLRKWSNRVSLAYKMMIISMIFWFICIGHRLILYTISNGSCGPLDPNSVYAIWDAWFEVITSAVFPPILMFILAYLLIRSVRGVIERRINPTNDISPPAATTTNLGNKNKSLLEQMSSKLTIMLILQSIITVITYVPYSVELAYTSITEDWSKSPLQKAGEKVFTELTHLLSYVFFASSFYVLLFSNNGFRRQLKRSLGFEKDIDPTTHQGPTVTIRTQTNIQIH